MATEDELAQTATATPVEATPMAVPARLGKYQLDGELGAGGMGVVFAAYDPDLERRVAIKLLRDSGGDISRARLLREARAMAKLAHPNVVTVYEVGTIDGRDFVAMELFEGQSLAEWLRESRPSQREILDAFVAAGHGLAAAHAENLVHRDFKPHNVLRGKRGRVAVTDFGLARAVDAKLAITRQLGGALPASPLLTATGAVLGTPAYMSPEQWDGGDVGPSTDQFAFCVALWEALAGERPFPGATGDELRAAIAKGPPDPKRVPRRFRALLRRGLDPHPARRFASMEALLLALEKARRPRWRRWFLMACGIAVGVMLYQRYLKPLPAPEPPARMPPPAAPPIPHAVADRAALLATIRDYGDREFSIPRRTRDQLVYDGRELFGDDGKLVPATNLGRAGGYKLYAIKGDGLFAHFGLLSGDTLMAIDNIALSPENAEKVTASIMSEDDTHTLDLVRAGKALRIAIEVN